MRMKQLQTKQLMIMAAVLTVTLLFIFICSIIYERYLIDIFPELFWPFLSFLLGPYFILSGYRNLASREKYFQDERRGLRWIAEHEKKLEGEAVEKYIEKQMNIGKFFYGKYENIYWGIRGIIAGVILIFVGGAIFYYSFLQ